MSLPTPTLLGPDILQPRVTAGIEQVVIELSTSILIPDFAAVYPSVSVDTFSPQYSALPDGSLATSAFLEDLRKSYTSLLVVALIGGVALRNIVVCVDYILRANMKRRILFYLLLSSQILSLGLAPLIASYFDPDLDCTAVLSAASASTGIALALLMSGILGLKAYRCLDSSRFILLILIALFGASTSILFLYLSSIKGGRRLSGGCLATTGNPQFIRLYVLIQLVHSLFLSSCFLYAVWKSRASPAARCRLSVRVSLDDIGNVKFDKPAPRTLWNLLRGRKNSASDLSRLEIPAPTVSDASYPSPASKDCSSSRTRRFPVAFWRHNVSDPIMEQSLVENDTATPRTRPTSLLRLIPRMELFHEVMKDELLYTTAITVTTVVLAGLVVLGVNVGNCLDLPSWLAVNETIISLLVIHCFGRVVRRHEREAFLQQSAAAWPDHRSRRGLPPSPMRGAVPASEDPFSDASAVRDSFSSWSSNSPSSPSRVASRDRRSSLVSSVFPAQPARESSIDEKGMF